MHAREFHDKIEIRIDFVPFSLWKSLSNQRSVCCLSACVRFESKVSLAENKNNLALSTFCELLKIEESILYFNTSAVNIDRKHGLPASLMLV
jgi:hypothetical protein